MIKDGLPYSNENGSGDDALLNDCSKEDIEKADRWIRQNIRKSDKCLEEHTSYGLKHLLENDTKVYLTNNQFKHAMMLAGYEPENPDELNWVYKIKYIPECNDNPSPFFIWVSKQYEGRPGPKGDFAQDMMGDMEFPIFADHNIIRNYLESINACDGAIDIFEDLWAEYSEPT